MIVIAPDAGALNPNHLNGCKNSTTAGAEMGHYPAWGGSQSYLRIACIFDHSTSGGGDFVSSVYTIHDFANARYHNGGARTMVATASAVGLTVGVADCTAALGFVNRTITGPNIPARTWVKSVTGPCTPTGTLNLSKATTGAFVGGEVLTIENSNVRQASDVTLAVASPMVCSATLNVAAGDAVGDSVDGTNIVPGTTISAVPPAVACPAGTTGFDLTNPPTAAGVNQLVTVGGTKDGSGGATTNGVSTNRTVNDACLLAPGCTATTITSTAARFFNTDIGLKVTGTGIIGTNCYIASRTNTSVTLSSACETPAVVATTITIGEPSRTAPLPTDTVLNQGVQLPLNPALVAGSQPCATDNSSGFGIEGTWVNPGSFVGGAFATQPPNTRAVGEILFTTSVITYAAFIIEVPAAPIGTDPLIGGYHFNVVSPNVPTGLALCASTATSPGLGFSIGISGTTVSQAAIPAGTGRPATGQLRSTVASTTGGTSTVFLTDDVSGPGVKWTGAQFNRACLVPAGTPDINFLCGDG